MKKELRMVSFVLVLTLISLFLVGCGESNKSPGIDSTKNDDAPIVIKASGPQASGEPPIKAMEHFKEIVEKRSNGRIQVEIFPDNQLGNERDVIEGIQLGNIEMAWPSNAPLTAFVPSLNIFELPYLFRSVQHMYDVLDSDIGMGFADDFEAKGFHLLGYFQLGVRHIMTVNKVINSIEDMKGLKIRTMENPAHLDAFKAFGANPLPMAYGELYTALESNVLDGAEAANTNYEAKKFYEPAPNWAMVGWMHLVTPVIINDKLYKNLPEDLKIIIDEAARETIELEREMYEMNEDEALEKLKAAGVKITEPDRGPFVEASQKVYNQWADKVGGRDKIDAILNYK